MKRYLVIVVIVILQSGCLSQENENDFSYIKVFIFNSADSLTAYNKDLGIVSYMYYDLKIDSIIYKDAIAFEPSRYETYVGHLNNKQYVDTIRSLVRVLSRHKNGVLPDSVSSDAVYCGPEFFVEYHDTKGEHYHVFILVGNDTLNQFSGFYSRLPSLPWQKKIVNNNLVNSDNEVVAAMRKLDLYDQLETPYIPLPCGVGIDKTKIVGEWRFIGGTNKKTNTYSKLTFRQNGLYVWEKVRESKSTERGRGRYKMNSRTNTLIINTGNKELRYKVLTLTRTCLRYMKQGGTENVQNLNRLQE